RLGMCASTTLMSNGPSIVLLQTGLRHFTVEKIRLTGLDKTHRTLKLIPPKLSPEEFSRKYEVLKQEGLVDLYDWLRKKFDMTIRFTATDACPICYLIAPVRIMLTKIRMVRTLLCPVHCSEEFWE